MLKMWLGKAIFLFVLFICAWTDMKKREILLFPILIGSIFGIGILFWQTAEVNVSQLLFRLLPGLCLMGFAVLSEGKLGKGDGLLICFGGLFLNMLKVLEWAFLSFIVCGLFGILLIGIKRKSLQMELPLAPFCFGTAVLLLFENFF